VHDTYVIRALHTYRTRYGRSENATVVFTDHFGGLDRASCPMCVIVCNNGDFLCKSGKIGI